MRVRDRVRVRVRVKTVGGPAGHASIEKPSSVISRVKTSAAPGAVRLMSMSMRTAGSASTLWQRSQVSHAPTSLVAWSGLGLGLGSGLGSGLGLGLGLGLGSTQSWGYRIGVRVTLGHLALARPPPSKKATCDEVEDSGRKPTGQVTRRPERASGGSLTGNSYFFVWSSGLRGEAVR